MKKFKISPMVAVIMVLIILVVTLIPISSYATVNNSKPVVTLVTNENKLSKGTTFTVTGTLSNTTTSNAIACAQFYVAFDNTKLEVTNVEATGTSYPSSTFSAFNGSRTDASSVFITVPGNGNETITKNGTLFTITFKVRETATPGETNFTFQNSGNSRNFLVADDVNQTEIINLTDTDVDNFVNGKVNITEEIKIESIEITAPETIKVGEAIQLTAKKIPTNATEELNITWGWSGTDKETVTMSESGLLKGLKPGKIIVIAKQNDGIYSTKEIEVKASESSENTINSENTTNTTNTENNINSNNTTTEGQTNSLNNGNNADTTTANGILPKTGSTIMIIGIIVIIAIIGIVIYIKNRDLINDKSDLLK